MSPSLYAVVSGSAYGERQLMQVPTPGLITYVSKAKRLVSSCRMAQICLHCDSR